MALRLIFIYLLAAGSVVACSGSGDPNVTADSTGSGFGLDSLELVSACTFHTKPITIEATFSDGCTGCEASNLQAAVDGRFDTVSVLSFPTGRISGSSIRVALRYVDGHSGDFPTAAGVRIGFSYGQPIVATTSVNLSVWRDGEEITTTQFTRYGSSGSQILVSTDSVAAYDEIVMEFVDDDPVEPLEIALEEFCEAA